MTLISVRFSQPIYLGDRIAVVAVTSPSAAQLPADAEKDGTAQRDIEVLKQFGVEFSVLAPSGCVAAEPALARVSHKIVGV